MTIIETEKTIVVRLDAKQHFIDLPGFINTAGQKRYSAIEKGVKPWQMQEVDTCPDLVFYLRPDDFERFNDVMTRCYSGDVTTWKKMVIVVQDGTALLNLEPVYGISFNQVRPPSYPGVLRVNPLSGWYEITVTNYSTYWYSA